MSNMNLVCVCVCIYNIVEAAGIASKEGSLVSSHKSVEEVKVEVEEKTIDSYSSLVTKTQILLVKEVDDSTGNYARVVIVIAHMYVCVCSFRYCIFLLFSLLFCPSPLVLCHYRPRLHWSCLHSSNSSYS